MNRQWLDEALSAAGLRSGQRFPRNLVLDITMNLPVAIIVLSGATTHGIRKWLASHGIDHEVSPTNRTLHGCLVAMAGQALVFIDGDDNEAEQRFTLAHEIAHFILDHMLPRMRTIRALGEQILPVLDGERQPTREEMLSAVLEHVPLGMQIHLMSRGPRGAICDWNVEECEQRADHLALELIAPSQCAEAGLLGIIDEGDNPEVQRHRAVGHLAERFGLPTHAAASYVDLLLGRKTGRTRLSEELFGRHQE